ncbi:MAG: ABC transporter permease subunit [Dehalococcoidia bacterium]
MIGLVLDLATRSRVALCWWLLGILSMACYVVAVYDSIGSLQDLRNLFEQYPESIREMFGEVDVGTMDGWIHLELLSWIPLVLGMYGGIFAAGTISRESEQRTVDFILGLPISRTQFIGSRLIVGLANIGTICAAIFLLLVVGVLLTGHTPSADRYALALLNAFLLGAALFSGYVLIASFTDEQSRVTGIAIGVTLVLYIATAALGAAEAPDWLKWLSPFEHYHSASIMSGRGVPILPQVALLVGTIMASAAALYSYNRRDIAV